MNILGLTESMNLQINDIRIALGLERLDLEASEKLTSRTIWKIGVESVFIFLIAVICVFQLLTAY